jgi:hypothetical protein
MRREAGFLHSGAPWSFLWSVPRHISLHQRKIRKWQAHLSLIPSLLKEDSDWYRVIRQCQMSLSFNAFDARIMSVDLHKFPSIDSRRARSVDLVQNDVSLFESCTVRCCLHTEYWHPTIRTDFSRPAEVMTHDKYDDTARKLLCSGA